MTTNHYTFIIHAKQTQPTSTFLNSNLHTNYYIINLKNYLQQTLLNCKNQIQYKFDKCNKSNSSNWFMQRVVRSDFMTISIDKLVHGLALLRGKNFPVKSIRTDSL